MKQKVFYYTSAYFFDVSIELIRVLKDQVDLYVFIEVTNASKNATILDIASLPDHGCMFAATEILSERSMIHFSEYFDGVKEVNFVVHNYSSANLLKAYSTLAPVRKMMRRLKPDVLHMEGYTVRSLGLFPLFGSVKKLLLAVHDSQVHSGMKNIKVFLPRIAAFKWPVKKIFVFYSKYSKNDFVKNIAHSKAKYLDLQLYKFTFLAKMSGIKDTGADYILFFGRISTYKGLDILLDAMVRVWEHYPNEKLVIAGGGADDELLAHPLLKHPNQNIIFHNRFIPAPELCAIISKAKFVVCPYKDATQSGVLVSSFAMNKPVLATNVGAFSEQVDDGVTGALIPAVTESSVAASILHALANEKYKQWEQFLINESSHNKWTINAKKLLEAYQ